MDVTDDAQGPLDPRIQIELENLNTATDDINKLEIELDEAETSFKHWQSESKKNLIEIKNRIGGGHIEKARCYYDALKLARQAQLQSQHQAHLFERASEIHATAKETVALAEARFISHKHEWNFDQAWQDMLNHATIKVRDAEDKKAICKREHQIKFMLFEEANKKVQQLEEKYRRAIIKARPFFDQQDNYEQEIVTQRAKISCLEKAIKEAKHAYSQSFRALEEISNEIHQQRRDYVMVYGPREPGVGAELTSPEESLNCGKGLNNISGDRMNSLASGSNDRQSDDSTQDIVDVLDLSERMDNIGGRAVDGSESTSNQWELELQASFEKLNTLSFKNSNWDSQINNEHSSTISGFNNDTINNCQSDMINNSSMLDQAIQQDYIHSKKLPIYIHILKKMSIKSDDEIDNNRGWQSLTQSPINSILNKSKVAIKNSLSKSLDNSPVIGGFNFSRAKIGTKLSSDNSRDATIIINRSIIDNIPLFENNQKYSNDTNDNAGTELTVPMNRFQTTTISDTPVKQSQFDVKADNENGNCSSDRNSLSSKESEQLAGDEKRNNNLLDSSCDIKFVNNPKFKETSCKISSIKELPLLSMFETSNDLQASKNKSCSMINLTEKPNLKSHFDTSAKGNIKAISVEKLANARHVLMAKHIDTQPESLCKK